ncbi:MAG: alpha/beta hydrolase [Eubacteriales bacterium]|nr:alpha/beta hydrolase [Eubacteriales bacterium]
MNKRKITALATVAGGVLSAVYIGVSQYFLNMTFGKDPKKRPHGGSSSLAESAKEGREWLHAHDHHIVTMRNSEGLLLRAHYIPCENAKRTLIEFHGWHGSWDVDFSGSSPHLHEMGCNLLLVEQRAQGESQGKYMTFGLKERYDLMEWVRWYQENIDADIPIYLVGLSMGATTVLMASSETFPQEVKGIIADCGFTSPYDIIKKVSKQWFHLPEHPFMDSSRFYTKKRLGIDTKSWSTIDAVSHATVPILFIHGKEDHFVPYEMTVKAYEACTSEKDILLVDGARHGVSFIVDQEAYVEKVTLFFSKYDEKQK